MLSVVCLIRKLLQYAIKLMHSQNVNGQKSFYNYNTEKLIPKIFQSKFPPIGKNTKLLLKEMSRLSSYIIYSDFFYSFSFLSYSFETLL